MNSSRGFDPFKQIRSHRNRFFARFRFLLSLVLTIALVWLPSQGILVGSHAASSGQEPQSGVQRVVGAPLPNLPNLDEIRTQRPRPPVALPPRPSTMRSKKSPLVPYDGRKVGDPLSVIRAPVPSVAPGPPPLDPQVPNNDELSKLKSDRRGRNARAHHPLGRRALMRAAAPFTVTEDQYIQDFFLTALARQPSTAELNYWHDIFRSAYANGQSALVLAVQELGKTLFESADYAARDGGLRLSNTEPHPHDFVADLYHAYLRRAPDQPAWDAWATYATTPNGHENTRHGFEFSSELYNLMGTITVGGSASSSVGSLVSARVDPENQAGTGLLGRSVDWSTSLLSLPGRAGLDLGLTLSYSSQVWTRSGPSDSPYLYFDEDNGYPSPGFRLGFPTIEWQSFDAQVGKKTYVLLTPAGNRVELRQIGTSGVYDAADSSYLLLIDYTNYLVLTMNDGTQMLYNAYNLQWRCTQIKDTNGNYLTINYDSVGRLTSITDTLARVITFNYDTYNNLNSITQNWNGTTHYWARFYWDNKITSGTFSGAAEVGTTSTASVPVVSEVRFADESSYRFTYNTYLQASAIRHADSTGYERMTTTFAYGSATNDCPRLDSSSVSASDWTGINGVPSAVTTTYGLEGSVHKLISPDGTIYKEFYGTGWQKGKVTQTEVWSGGTRQKYTTTSYAQDNTSVNYPINPRVTETTVNDASNHRRVTIDYVSSTLPTGTVMKLPSDVKEYAANQTTVYRRTHIDYISSGNYVNRNILMLPERTALYDGNNNLMSKTKYSYDASGEYLVSTSAAPTQHDASYSTGFLAGRGNVTQVMQVDISDASELTGHTRRMGYDINGSLVFTKDALNHTTSISYQDVFSVAPQNRNTFAYPTTFTDPDGNSSLVTYNFDFGAKTKTQGPPPALQSQGAIQEVTYDTVGRVERTTTANNGAYTRHIYGPNYIQSFSTVNNVADEAYSIQYFDGLGRVILDGGNHPGSSGGYRAVWTQFDLMGRVTRKSNPTEINSGWAPYGDDPAWVFIYIPPYDWKGRILQIYNQDWPTHKTLEYEGCGCAGGEVVTLTDEVGRKQKVYSDLFGRQWKKEILNSDLTVYSAMVTTYNERDQITNIREWSGPADGSGTYQDTTYTYDNYGRLVTKHIPEQSGVTTWHYYADDTVDWVEDARGAVTTFGYSNRGLVESITQTMSGSPTISVTNDYDAAGNRFSMSHSVAGILKDSLSLSYDQLSRVTSETRYIGNLGNSFQISYDYTLSNQVKSVTDPFSSTTTLNYDAIGRTSSVSGSFAGTNYTYVSGVGYRAWGGVKNATFGDSSSETVSYNDRMQPTHFELGGGMHYDYSYFADGRLKEFKDLNDQVGDPQYVQFHYMSRAYSYDNAGRVTSVGQLANYGVIPPFSGTYSYDAFDNTTTRSGKYALNNDQYDSASYTNNRRSGWYYNNEGQVTSSTDTSDLGGSSTRSWTYDAGGKLILVSETRNSQITTTALGYDGDGELLGEIINGSTADYLVRSSVLGTVLTKLTAAGGKDITYVPTNGLDAPMQHQNPGYSPYMAWVHRDALGVQETSGAYDPFGNLVANVQPPVGGGPPGYTPVYGPPYGWGSNSATNANNLATGCNLRGVPTSCNNAMASTMGVAFVANLPGQHLDMVLGETQYAGFVNQKFAQMAQKKPKNPPSLKKLSEQEKAALKRIKKQRGTNPFNIGNDELATFDFDQITRLVTTALSSSECIEFYTTILSRASSKRNPVLQGGDLQKVFQSFMSQTTQPFTRKLPPFATRNASGYAFGLIGSKQGGGIYIVTSSSLDQAYVDAKVVIGELFHLAGSTDMYRDRELADLVHNSKFNVDESKLDPTDNVFSGQYVKGEYETEDTPYSIYFHRMAEMNCRLPQFAYP